MTSIFLHGGGDHPNSREATLGRFVSAVTASSPGRLVLVVAEAIAAEAHQSFLDYQAIFASLPAPPAEILPLFVSPTTPLTRDHLAALQPTGLFVCGGVTPFYHQALCVDTEWLGEMHAKNIPYGGTSAGAAIAARQAILGGWRLQREGELRQILFQGAGEGLDTLTVGAGLALVPFSVEVHASQWGTLTRLIHAVATGLVKEGWAIDENTLLEVQDESLEVYGQGHIYHVRRRSGAAPQVAIYTAPARIKHPTPMTF
jgi:cyanophycinase